MLLNIPRLTSVKHSNLLGQFLSYQENEVLLMHTLGPMLLDFSQL
jgi:hypothetical protein